MNEQQPQVRPPAGAGRRWIFVGIVILIIAVVIFIFWLTGRGWQSTDDAQVEGNLVPITPRITGYVDQIYVDDNQPVVAGAILIQLDKRNLLAALKASEANLLSAMAQESAATAQLALIEKTAPAGAAQSGAGTQAAAAGVEASQSQIAAAEAQAASAQAAANAVADTVKAARSNVATADAQIEAAQAALQSAQAAVTSAQAQANKAAADAARYEQLYNRGAVSRQQLEAIQTANTSAQAGLQSAKEGVRSASAAIVQAQTRKTAAQAGLQQAISQASSAQAAANQAKVGVAVARTALSEAQARLSGAKAGQSGAQTVPQQLAAARAQQRTAMAKVKQASADVQNARLQLSYATITAPVSGVVSQKSVQPGQFVQPGQPLMSVVPLSDVWIVANFKETQVQSIKTGQPVVINVDAYPGREFHGYVQSIGAATGSQFSVLPPENATGNYVKVVQRIPVKILLNEKSGKPVLRPGMNVTANVNTRGGR